MLDRDTACPVQQPSGPTRVHHRRGLAQRQRNKAYISSSMQLCSDGTRSDRPDGIRGTCSRRPGRLGAKLWYPDVDGVLFDEAVRCFEQTAYRAALVMTWLAIAEGLRHRFEVAAQRDLELTSLLEEVAPLRRGYAHPLREDTGTCDAMYGRTVRVQRSIVGRFAPYSSSNKRRAPIAPAQRGVPCSSRRYGSPWYGGFQATTLVV
jgi:hypothetical protein